MAKREKTLTERATINFTDDDLKLIDKARNLLSQDLSNFVRGAALEKARHVVNQLTSESEHGAP
jgi:uncharacterized protein (DUF1778 family)